ncbi:MAG: DNA polymerase III subunit gamma/tau [Bacteroidales bacterium]|nr:DNA polymerase III subunit gamma/tau [Bacteroidales bacterium]MBR5054129.1 DNA polymerase III subunit gamma/tau [Bacteroidales bacterium]
MSQYIVSARKYRPDSFESLIGQDNIARTLKNSILRGQLAHAYLFCGPRGVGKTSTARIFAKTINCAHPNADMEPCGECESCVSFREGRSYCIHELDAASNNGVDDIKALMEQVQIPPQVGRYSVYIIDEVHMLSQAAFNAFLKTLEEPPAHAIFILATTEKHKILPTILSRCQTYDFNRIGVADIVKNLRDIAGKENVSIDDESLHIIAQKADGAMRDALTIFDQTVAFCGADVHYEDVIRNLNVLDYEYSFRLVDAFRAGDYAAAMLTFDEILAKGFNAQHFISALSSHLRDLIVSRTAGLDALLDLPASLKQRYRAQAEACTLQFLYDALAITTQCEAGYKAAINQRLHIEFALMKLAFLSKGVPATVAAPVEPPTPPESKVESPGGVGAGNCATLGNIRGGDPSEKLGGGPAQQDVSGTHPLRTETKPAPEVAPEPQSEVQPEPVAEKKRRRPAKTGASLSLNSLMGEKEDTRVETAATEAPVAELTDEEIAEKWKEMSGLYPNQPRLANTLANAKVEVSREDGMTVTFVVTNDAQRAWIESNKLHELEGRFQKLLGRPGVRLLVAAAQFVDEKVIYTPEDKAKYLMENVPEVIDIISDLGLDIK